MSSSDEAAVRNGQSTAAAVDVVLEARALRRRLFRWRLGSAILVGLIVLGVVLASDEYDQPHIARFEVFGLIVDDTERDALLNEIAEDENVEALIVRIDSPGGTTVGGEALYESLRNVADKKPVVAVMGEVAASAGYITAMAADHIVARGNTITASIGVIYQSPNFAEAMEAVGVQMVEVKSGVQKAEPSPFRPFDESKLEPERILINDSFDWFIGLVEERRDPTNQQLSLIRDGRVLTGRMAMEAGLVDEIGGQNEAISWLENERDVPTDLPVSDWSLEVAEKGLFEALFEGTSAFSGWLERGQEFFDGPALVSKIR
ncbi:MAG: signal peptide peptidase SppA [Pseudomonadota bacterium]